MSSGSRKMRRDQIKAEFKKMRTAGKVPKNIKFSDFFSWFTQLEQANKATKSTTLQPHHEEHLHELDDMFVSGDIVEEIRSEQVTDGTEDTKAE